MTLAIVQKTRATAPVEFEVEMDTMEAKTAQDLTETKADEPRMIE
jgi:hypothetical protein